MGIAVGARGYRKKKERKSDHFQTLCSQNSVVCGVASSKHL